MTAAIWHRCGAACHGACVRSGTGERRRVGEIGLAGNEVADQRLDELEAGDRLLRRGAGRVLAARRRVDVDAGS
jgi:hypothetical protein